MREALEAIARKAGSMIAARDAFEIEEKEGHANYVTTIDQNVQAYLEEALLKLLPGSCVIGEEKDNDTLTDAPTWIIDPVDGTTNLIHDYRFSAVSIALVEKGKAVMGAVYQPYTEEFFYARRGEGCWLNDRRVKVTKNDLPHALVGFGTSPYNAELAQKSMELALRFLYAASDVRRSGSAALDLAYVASGRQDVFFELTLKPWDFAAGVLLVEEAGGTVQMPFSPDGVRFDRPQAILASNLPCAEAAREIFDSIA